jgi:peptidoglycan hydrolase-like protein with peptidoglycan-binding domain
MLGTGEKHMAIRVRSFYQETPTRRSVAIVSFMLSLLIAQLGHASFFDRLVNDAQRSIERGVQGVIDGAMNEDSDEAAQNTDATPQTLPSPVPPAATPSVKKPTYDRALVKDIQQRLNGIGFDPGPPDGIYGAGTRQAIESFQRSQGLAVDGKPTAELLAQIESTKPTQASVAAKSKTTQSGGLPEPTLGAMSLAAVHFRPEILDNELLLKQVLQDAHPEHKDAISNEFQWHKRKAEFKQQLLEEAKNAQLEFEVQPWRDSSIAKARRIELIKYDFDRSAYLVRFSTGTAREIMPRMLLIGNGLPLEKYEQDIDYAAIPADEAERIANYFGSNKRRHVYPNYKIRVVGAVNNPSRPSPLIEFIDDELQLYAVKGNKFASDSVADYTYLTSVSLPTKSKAAASANGASQTEKTHQKAQSSGGVVANAEVDGIKLLMPVTDALEILKAKGFEMDALRPEHPVAGGRSTGRADTEDGAGRIKVRLSYKGGVVFEYHRQVLYLADRIPAGGSPESLADKYRQEFDGIFAKAKYAHADSRGNFHVDDVSPPPYDRKIFSPHAKFFVSQPGNPRFIANVDLAWREAVGIER